MRIPTDQQAEVFLRDGARRNPEPLDPTVRFVGHGLWLCADGEALVGCVEIKNQVSSHDGRVISSAQETWLVSACRLDGGLAQIGERKAK